MDRKTALKLMGSGLAATFMAGFAPITHAAILRDRAKEKKRLVFYFTATGNSLFVAKQFSDNPLSIPQELKKENLIYEADEIGFVFPNYCATAPKIVRQFLEKGTFKAPYIFSVITYGAHYMSVADWWNSFAKEHGVVHNYIQPIIMVDIALTFFDMVEEMAMDKKVDENLAKLLEEVGSHKNSIVEVQEFLPEHVLKGLQGMLYVPAEEHFELRKDRCIECLTCAKVCPHNNFSIGDNGLQFAGECEFCHACIQNCPQKALTIKPARPGMPGERNPEARYRNPNISLNEIIKSNRQ
jgi:ferredoxin